MNARADIDLVLPCYNPPSAGGTSSHPFPRSGAIIQPGTFPPFIVSDGSRRGYEPETIDRSGN